MLVARTDRDAPKHKGLTYFLMDMEQDAVQVRPLRQITGEAEFNELFIEEARIPDANVARRRRQRLEGRADDADERARRPRRSSSRSACASCSTSSSPRPPRAGCSTTRVVADKLGDLHVKAEILRLTAYRGLTAIEKYGQPGPGGLADQVDVVGDQPAAHPARRRPARPRGARRPATRWTYELLRARGNSIEGGTTEILKNIVAERVLGLPQGRARRS